MCVDISYNTVHFQAHTRPSCSVLINPGAKSTNEIKMSWGVVMDFMLRDAEQLKKFGNSMFNARIEKIGDTNSVWHRLINNRCLLIADGIFEHQHKANYNKKIPYFISLKSKKQMLLPAIYAPTLPGYSVSTFAILTRPANELMKTIHNDGPNKHRMPLFMEPEMARNWLNSAVDVSDFLSYEIPSENLAAHSVYTIRNNAIRPDGKDKIDYYNWDLNEQATLF